MTQNEMPGQHSAIAEEQKTGYLRGSADGFQIIFQSLNLFFGRRSLVVFDGSVDIICGRPQEQKPVSVCTTFEAKHHLPFSTCKHDVYSGKGNYPEAATTICRVVTNVPKILIEIEGGFLLRWIAELNWCIQQQKKTTNQEHRLRPFRRRLKSAFLSFLCACTWASRLLNGANKTTWREDHLLGLIISERDGKSPPPISNLVGHHFPH